MSRTTTSALAAAAVVLFALRSDPEKACDSIAVPSGWTIPEGMRPTVAATLDRILMRYATEWRDFAKSSCVAEARRELSKPAYATMQRCLDHRKDTLLWIMKQPTDVLRLAESLEPVETCRGRSIDAVPSAELAALQRDLSRAMASAYLVPETATGNDELLRRAKQADDQTSIAEASYLLGLSQHARGLDPTESLQAAITAAERARDDRIRTRASAVLAIVTARKGRLSEALMQRDVAVSAAAIANDAVTTIAVERANIELAFIRRDFDAEIAAFRRIEAIQLARFGELSGSLVETRFKLAGALLRRRHRDGKHMLDLAIEGMKQLTEMSPAEALAQAILAERNPATRLPMQERLVEIVRRDDPPALLKELDSLGSDYELVGAYDRALQTMREAMAIASPPSVSVLGPAAHYAFEIADRSDDAAVRTKHLDEALQFLEQLPADAKDGASIQAIRGRILLRAGRAVDALPFLTNALAAAERTEPQEPYHIGIRSFALAQALWEIGGVRERARAIALAEQAARRLPEVRAELAKYQNGALLGRLDDQLGQIEAWRRTHR